MYKFSKHQINVGGIEKKRINTVKNPIFIIFQMFKPKRSPPFVINADPLFKNCASNAPSWMKICYIHRTKHHRLIQYMYGFEIDGFHICVELLVQIAANNVSRNFQFYACDVYLNVTQRYFRNRKRHLYKHYLNMTPIYGLEKNCHPCSYIKPGLLWPVLSYYMCLEIISIDGCVLQRNCKTWHVIISKDSLGDYLNLQRTSNQIRYISHQYIISIYKESAKIKSILDRSTREASHPLLRLNFISLRRKQNRRHFADDVFKCNFFEWKCLNSDRNFTEVCS